MAADLHCHTRMSDGSIAIDELVLLAKNKGIGTIAVTDHDTFAGATRAKIFGDRHGVEVIQGIEISAYDNDRDRKVHILGYCCESPDRLEGLCKKIGESRRMAANIMMQKVMRLYPIPAEMVMRRAQGCTNIYKQHIMHALIDAGYTTEMFGSLFQKLFNPRGGLAYCPIEYPDVHDVIKQIHGAGGLAVMAHPGQYDGHDLMMELADSGEIDGIEVWHPVHKKEDIPQYVALARLKGLLMTGGSDFHGMYTSHPCALGAFLTPDEQLSELKKRKKLLKANG
ncbi:PHP domain-containing protein [Clostridium minihomine]|uniref:PHP domain-containing protein n=1 Tax=Clostridium minihomine TaxID=2045012 RepID=UPI000C76A3FB|nr:PHP domain-containing protein [Clostridium minihomine]